MPEFDEVDSDEDVRIKPPPPPKMVDAERARVPEFDEVDVDEDVRIKPPPPPKLMADAERARRNVTIWA